MVSSVLVAKPPIFSILAWLREHILSNILSIVAGDAGNIQYQYLQGSKTIYMQILNVRVVVECVVQ